MIKRICTLPVITALLIASLSGALSGLKDIKAKIIDASNPLFDASTTKDEIVNSLIQLLDVAASITSTSEYKDDIRYRIDVAKDLFKKDSLFNDKARQYLSFAYRMMTNGRKYQKPEELDEFVSPAEAQEKAQKYARKLVEKALASLEDGKKEETAKLLLELVLMIVTPISG